MGPSRGPFRGPSPSSLPSREEYGLQQGTVKSEIWAKGSTCSSSGRSSFGSPLTSSVGREMDQEDFERSGDGSEFVDFFFEDLQPGGKFSYLGEGTETERDGDGEMETGDKDRPSISSFDSTELLLVDPSVLPRRSFVEFTCRLSRLRLFESQSLWSKVIARIQKEGQNGDLTPTEVTWVLQALAYARGHVKFEPRQVTPGLLKSVARHASEFSEESLCRVLHACAKGRLGNPKFYEFLLSEVMEKMKKFSPRELNRILSSVARQGLHADEGLVPLLAARVLKKIVQLPSWEVKRFVEVLWRADLLRNEEVIDRLNSRCFALMIKWQHPEDVLELVPLIFMDVFSGKLVNFFLKKITRLGLPDSLVYPDANSSLEDIDGQTCEDEEEALREQYGRVNSLLLPLKEVECLIRTERTQ
eukprot:Cvel_24856.t1-p1 / transcript=Cvel_24856.t1 / gene=Cvel_24856 / organism=Chromera_velia_CCMP2878 / gene_product=hypothetical protein / transcript_product=hypothetical protein / location=Cvel_scaffold2744:234-4158(-) / protein_length=415 / sequence_SO=supercontig / SO=protein_coding / is_pseudo=false